MEKTSHRVNLQVILPQVRRVYQNKNQTNKQTGKMFCQTWYQNKQTNRWDVLSKHDIKSNVLSKQTIKQTNRWDVLSNMISNQRWYQNKPTNKQVFSKQTCHLLNCYKWIFHGSKLLNFPESIYRQMQKIQREIFLTLHFFQRRGFLNILSWFETGQEKCVDFCSVAIEFAKIEFVKNLDSKFKLLYFTSLQLH